MVSVVPSELEYVVVDRYVRVEGAFEGDLGGSGGGVDILGELGKQDEWRARPSCLFETGSVWWCVVNKGGRVRTACWSGTSRWVQMLC